MKNNLTYLWASALLNIIFVLVIILIGYRYFDKLYKKAFLKDQIKIVMFGNSITAWGNWDELLDRDDVKVSGFPGYTSSHLSMLVDKNVIEYEPEICFVMVGINDLQVGIPIQRIQENYIQILADLKVKNIKPVVESVLYTVNNRVINYQVDSLNTFLVDYCKSNNVDFIDLNKTLSTASGLNPENSTDGIHLSSKAYQIWGEEIQNYLKSHNF